MERLKDGSVICGHRAKVRVGYAPANEALGLKEMPGTEHDGICVRPDEECPSGGHLMHPAWRMEPEIA